MNRRCSQETIPVGNRAFSQYGGLGLCCSQGPVYSFKAMALSFLTLLKVSLRTKKLSESLKFTFLGYDQAFYMKLQWCQPLNPLPWSDWDPPGPCKAKGFSLGPAGIAALDNMCCIICRARSRYVRGRILQGELNSALRSEHVP